MPSYLSLDPVFTRVLRNNLRKSENIHPRHLLSQVIQNLVNFVLGIKMILNEKKGRGKQKGE